MSEYAETIILCLIFTYVGMCLGAALAMLLMLPKKKRKPEPKPKPKPLVWTHAKLDDVTQQAVSEVWWLRANRDE